MTTPQPTAPAPNPTVRGVHLPNAGANFGKKAPKKPMKKPAPQKPAPQKPAPQKPAKPAPKRGGGKR